MMSFLQKAFVELIGDRLDESCTENFYNPARSLKVVNLNLLSMGTNELPFQIIHAHAAGIDVGSRSHLVAVDQSKENVRAFGVNTKGHQALILHYRRMASLPLP